jgi:hypothetical protein
MKFCSNCRGVDTACPCGFRLLEIESFVKDPLGRIVEVVPVSEKGLKCLRPSSPPDSSLSAR